MVDIEKCQLVRYPATILAHRAENIEKIDDNIRQLAEKMVDIMLENSGVGLAGPQAGVGLQIFIIALEPNKEAVRVYINPVITPAGGLVTAEEGCLSVPDVYTKIKRYERCSVTATDLSGDEFTEEAEGLYARVLQHENDHLEGITIVNRMGATARIVHRKQIKKLAEKHEKAVKEEI